MMKFIFKTIFIFSLIISMVIPTYAAVSVSDGSAFVTKAEFSADLNNLSNRMASLENALDAKIDSLVSSYLTRNGIWNGAKQMLLNDSFKYGFKSGSTMIGKYWYNIYNGASQQSSGGRYRIDVSGNSGDFDLVDSVNKSGMLFFNTANGLSGNGNMTAVPVSSATGVINLANVRWIYECVFSYNVLSGGVGIAETKNIASCQLLGFGIGCSLQVPNLPVGTVSFFVAKGDKVVLNASQIITTYSTTGNDASTLALYKSNEESFKTYVIKDCYIY